MATILVTGGLGFIGHNVVAVLESQGHTCIVTDTQTTYGIVPRDELDYLIAERRRKIKTDRIYGIDIAEDAAVKITMTLTSPSCPVAETLPPEVEDKIKSVEGVSDCKVEITWEPTWDKSMMSQEAQLELGFL